MAVYTLEYWNPNRSERDDPPESWVRVTGLNIPDVHTEDEEERIKSGVKEWLSEGGFDGEFCYVTTRYFTKGADMSPSFVYAFSCAQTAFAFKLRYG